MLFGESKYGKTFFCIIAAENNMHSDNHLHNTEHSRKVQHLIR